MAVNERGTGGGWPQLCVATAFAALPAPLGPCASGKTCCELVACLYIYLPLPVPCEFGNVAVVASTPPPFVAKQAILLNLKTPPKSRLEGHIRPLLSQKDDLLIRSDTLPAGFGRQVKCHGGGGVLHHTDK